MRRYASWSGENARLENELRKAHLIIDVQGKVAGLLGISLDDGTKLLKAADELAKHVGVKTGVRGPRGLPIDVVTVVEGPSTGQQQPRPTPARALSETERGEVFDTLCSERFVDRSPAEVVANAARRRGLPVQRTHDVSCSGLRGAGFRNAGRSAPIPSTRSPS